MKNNILYKVSNQRDISRFLKNRSIYSFCFLVVLLISQKSHAQFVNQGQVIVNDETIFSVYEDYQNTDSGVFTNDGQVYIFKNWNNDGVVNFTNVTSGGKTFFNGLEGQFIEGKNQSDFQNVQFKNAFENAPFYLGTKISVNKKAEFVDGIVNGVDLPGALVVFNENAIHEKVGDHSFVDGKVQKKGTAQFQFPIGSDKYYRPSEHRAGRENSIYTTQYFYKNSDFDGQHSHESKDPTILEINDKEYWEVKQNQGTEKIVLSLTLDHDTTPYQFFDQKPGTKLAIVRWDETKNIWVNESGELSNTINDEAYSNLLTSKVTGVSGYGLFTMALVKNTEDIDSDGLVIYNAVSPNGDGLNDTFRIKGIESFPDNTVEIYNRWGVKVYDAKGYNETNVMFAGYSDGRATINRNEKLPTGTYFYILKYNNGEKVKEKAGYLYINNQ
ncbi:gliding motility-associated C-terminal domain-containing protein [Flavobacterium sp. 2]|uniref:gliding motility-associated C-terminal domain-containing protein n=1 Tax=Flavobacterium sp. 2 TaxID=308053 RepID=UPI003CE86F20